jgi:hypothetical protein
MKTLLTTFGVALFFATTHFHASECQQEEFSKTTPQTIEAALVIGTKLALPATAQEGTTPPVARPTQRMDATPQQKTKERDTTEILADKDLTKTRLSPYANKGKSVITGQAFLKTRGGDIKTGAGNKVILAPASEYVKLFYKQRDFLMTQINKMYDIGTPDALKKYSEFKAEIDEEKPDSRLIPLMKTTIADASGNFEFKGLPAGKYMLFCEIYWETGKSKTGGIAYGSVKISNDETQKVMVSEPILSSN